MKQELQQRLNNLQSAIIEANADACVITSSVNQYYLCDFIFDGYLYVLPEGEPTLFVRRPVGVEGENVIYIRKPEQIPDFISATPKRVMLETDVLSYNTTLRLQAALHDPEIVNVSGKLREIRSVKSEYELSQLRESAKIQADIYRQIPSLYRAGITDIEFQADVEHLMRKNGSIGIFRAYGENMDIFMGSVLAGDNAQTPSPFDFAMGGGGVSPALPIGASGVTLKEGMTIMFDMTGNYTAYQSDMTRTFAIGKIDEIAYRAHAVSVEMNQWVLDNVKPGTSCAEVYAYALETAKKYGLEDNFMGTKQQAKFVGHGVGIEINEPPVLTLRSKEVFLPNMAFAFEPKFVLPGIGGVGIENTFVVTESGVEKITICEEKIITL